MFIWRIIVLVLAIQLAGCVSVGRARKLERELNEFKSMVGAQQKDLRTKEEEIAALRKLITDQDAALQERSKKVDDLKKKLEGFGVF